MPRPPRARRDQCVRVCVLALLVLLRPWVALAQRPSDGIASLVIDLKSGTTLSAEQPDVISRTILPGSVMKIAVLAAALESGAITERTSVLCTRAVLVNGHQLTCTHPDLHRPLTAAEALTHSCNVFVASVTARVSREAFDRTRANLGLPPSGTADLRAAALGLEGPRITPRTLIDAVAKVARVEPALPWKPATLDVIRRGLRGAATVGTAAALKDAGIDAMAKTGTVDAGGISQGLVVGVTPATNPTRGFAVLVSGAAGRDAASVAAELLVKVRLKPGPTTVSPSSTVGRGVRLQADQSGSGGTGQRLVRVGVVQRNGGTAIREMALDDYVAGVIAGEQATGSAPQALEALAIVARTYALANAGRHQAEGFDLCDLTHCQVLRASTAASRSASARTAGQYLSEGDTPADVYYTASCGGHTEKPSNVWRGARDSTHLPSRADDACGGAPAWQSELSARELLVVLRQAGFKGEALRGLRVTARTGSGRVAWLAADGLTPSEISGENLRTLVGRTLGWQHLRSTLFDVTRTGAGYRFAGKGAGHGVGLCVLGAAARATRGTDTRAILREYFPGLDVKTLPESGAQARALPELRLQVPAEERAGQAELQRLATRWLAETAAALDRTSEIQPRSASHEGTKATMTSRGVLVESSWPEQLTLRFHPTVESYQRQTGSPWFTAATTTRDTIDLLPLRVLRARGLLESTLRHEFVHALTFDALRRAPRWVSEGLGEWIVGALRLPSVAQGKQGGGAEACPSDAAFRAAASAEALRALYSRAAACVERELRQGTPWPALANLRSSPTPDP